MKTGNNRWKSSWIIGREKLFWISITNYVSNVKKQKLFEFEVMKNFVREVKKNFVYEVMKNNVHEVRKNFVYEVRKNFVCEVFLKRIWEFPSSKLYIFLIHIFLNKIVNFPPQVPPPPPPPGWMRQVPNVQKKKTCKKSSLPWTEVGACREMDFFLVPWFLSFTHIGIKLILGAL